MTKLITLLGSAALALVLAACGAQPADSPDTTPATADANATSVAKLVLDSAPD